MYDFIKDHALKNVWCTPDQDKQLIIEPSRLTADGGVLHFLDVMWRRIYLPDQTSTWHVYQIGQVHPLIVGLLPKANQWHSFSEAMNQKKMIADIYVNTGVQLPRFDTYYMYNQDRDVIVAVRRNDKIPFDFDTDKVFIRLYTNAYYSSKQADAVEDVIHTEGKLVRSSTDIINLQQTYLTYKEKIGLTYVFVNGIKVTDIDLIHVKIGDYAEFVYDSSVYKVVDLRVGNLLVFNSSLDSKMKYLLHYSGPDNQIIDYRDDIDIFVLNPMTGGRHQGVYYHKNLNDSFRMVTHRDYAAPSAYVNGYLSPIRSIANDNTIMYENLYLRLHIRRSGYNRPLIFEANRIAELYKMNDEDIMGAMIGLDAVADNWKAETLEASPYIKIMDSKCCDITNEMIEDAYGYNSLSRIIGNTPTIPYSFSGRMIVGVPYGLQTGMTAYEYDSEGILLEYNQQSVGSIYTCNNPKTRLVEIISGAGERRLSDKVAANNISVDITEGYRVYFNSKATVGVPSDWVDVTDTSAYIVVNGQIQRSDGIMNGTFMVRDEKKFLAYDVDLDMSQTGVLRFGLMQDLIINGFPTPVTLQVPLNQLDIFLNGKSLIRDLDYYLNFPEVVIVNKEYLNNPLNKLQEIHVRMTGVCNDKLTVSRPGDLGFIDHGVLSENSKFNLRDDRVLRIVIDGKLYTRDELLYSEFQNGVSILNPENGKPYSIQDIIVPLKWLTTEPSFKLKEKALAIDTVVSDYLTLKIPEPEREFPSAIANRYSVYSPFVCAIIYALNNGTFNKAILSTNYTLLDVRRLCTPYLYLLKSDPTQQQKDINTNYIIVHPHNLTSVIDIDVASYVFIQKVVKFYTNNLIELSPFLRLQTT